MKRKNLLIILILIIALFTRLWRLDEPDNFYFDEVYHAFTAREFLLGNKLAWEFSASSPPGFAYEWTHPPLAKELMVVGMAIWGINPFGWRFFGAIAGVGVVFLVWSIAKKLFQNNLIAILASTLLAFETLIFTQSRIGMNDIYFLFFVLSAIYFLISDKFLISGALFGLAAASKWTAVYFLLVAAFYLSWKLFKEKVKLNYFLLAASYLLIPVLIYLASYLPFFLQGKNLQEFWQLQQQMYWYHTKLKATHAYQSAWYTWPLDARPVYYYLGQFDDKVAKTYAMGNPAIFWAGLAALAYAIYQFIKKPRFNLGLVLTSYFAFFLPWAVSPRIMFIYHYLPSVPFLILTVAFSLSTLWKNPLGRILAFCYLFSAIGLFIYFYPHIAAIPVTTSWDNQYFWFESWR